MTKRKFGCWRRALEGPLFVVLSVVSCPAWALRVTVPANTPRSLARPPAALNQHILRAFRIMHAFTNGKAVDVCEARVLGLGTVHALARRIGIPLWALERVNPGRNLNKVPPYQLRIPVLTHRALARCFTPVRPWVARPDSGPPFYW